MLRPFWPLFLIEQGTWLRWSCCQAAMCPMWCMSWSPAAAARGKGAVVWAQGLLARNSLAQRRLPGRCWGASAAGMHGAGELALVGA